MNLESKIFRVFLFALERFGDNLIVCLEMFVV